MFSVGESGDICFSATYNLSIKVGDVKGSGTDGNVYIQLFGERGNTAKIQLRQAGDTRNKFEKGRTYKFTVDTVDIGKVQYMYIAQRGEGGGGCFAWPAWFPSFSDFFFFYSKLGGGGPPAPCPRSATARVIVSGNRERVTKVQLKPYTAVKLLKTDVKSPSFC